MESGVVDVMKIGGQVEFQYKSKNYVVQEYRHIGETPEYIWTCRQSDTKKLVWSGNCRSTADCIRFTKDFLDR